MFTNAPSMRRIVPCMEDGIPELWEGEDINFKLDRVELATNLDLDHPLPGTLYVTSKRVIWLGHQSAVAYDFDVPYITLHAISRDPNSFPKPCVYCQLDEEMPDDILEDCDEEDDGESTGDQDSDGNDQVMTEIYLVPEEERDIQSIFDALSHAAMLNPDPEEEGDDAEGYDDFIYNLEEVQLGAEQAKALEHLESVFQFPPEAGEGDYDEEDQNGEDEEDDDNSMQC